MKLNKSIGIWRRNRRKVVMIKMRMSINPKDGKYYSVQAIADKYRLSRQRVEQIIGKTGWVNSPVLEDRKCDYCGASIKVWIFRHRLEKKHYCRDTKCFHRAKTTIIPGKLRSEWNADDKRKFYKIKNYLSCSINARKKYNLTHKDELAEKQRLHPEYIKKYCETHREKISEYRRNRYANDEVYRKKQLERCRLNYRLKKEKKCGIMGV